MKPEEIPQELIDILDRNAQRKHSRTGSVITTLAEILTAYDNIKEDKCDTSENMQKKMAVMGVVMTVITILIGVWVVVRQ